MSPQSQRFVILHVTDLHLAIIGAGSREFLRTGYYEEYLRAMWEKVSKHLPQPIDLIVATGDFVDRGCMDCFPHARNVLLTLAKLVGVDESCVAVCIGNHDIDRAKDQAGDHDAAREAFTNFSKHFSDGKTVHASHRASLFRYDNGIYSLMLDGTRGSPKPDIPAVVNIDVADHLINDFVKKVPEDNVLVIGSHYPIAPFPDDFGVREEGPEYLERHFWKEAIAFKRRVTALRTKAPTLWLFGDVHNSDAYSEGTHIHVITGRLGVRVPVTPKPESQLPRQCRAVVLTWNGDIACDVVTGNFILTTHVPQPEIGEWIVESSPSRRTKAITPAGGEKATQVSIPALPQDTAKKVIPTPTHSVSVLDKNLNSLIYEKIRDNELCRMGRFRTTGDYDSLAWVSVGPILGSGEYLSRFCSASLSWLGKTYNVKPHYNGGSVLFLGIDCWGASIATILGVACGSEALCVAVRADGRYHTVGELLDDNVIAAIDRSETIVIVTDVIATGRSIAFLYAKIKELSPDAIRAKQQWLALSVLIDANQPFLQTCPFLTGVGVGCADIKLPSVPSNVLPGDDIAPAIVSFS